MIEYRLYFFKFLFAFDLLYISLIILIIELNIVFNYSINLKNDEIYKFGLKFEAI